MLIGRVIGAAASRWTKPRAAGDTIGDLRSRLKVEQEERRRLSMLLAAPSAQSQPPQSQPQRNGWWARLFGGEW